MIPLNNILTNLINTQSDINEHLPVLLNYAKQCNSVTEFGVRGVISTIALISGNPQKMVSVDLFHPDNWNCGHKLNQVMEYAKENKIDYKFILGDTRYIDIEKTDLLFIDTLHTYQQLKAELDKHHTNVNKFLIFHDTESYEYSDEYNSYTHEFPNTNKHGLWPAIEEFLKKNKEWKLLERRINNNGLTILEKVSQ